MGRIEFAESDAQRLGVTVDLATYPHSSITGQDLDMWCEVYGAIKREAGEGDDALRDRFLTAVNGDQS